MAFKSPDADITVFQFPKSVLIPSTSVFCLKLETYFRMANIQYKIERTFSGSSKGKLPYITHKGKQVEDTNFIIKYINKELEVDLNANLSPAEKAIAHGFKRMIEENLYWVSVYHRWIVENGAFLKRMPLSGMRKKLLPVLMAVKVKPNLKSELNGHGIGRHTKEQVYEIGEDDIRALSAFLGEKPYFMGNEVSEIDATVFGLAAQYVYALPDTSLEKFVGEHANNLVAYCERIREKYWPDWTECCMQLQEPKKPEEQAAEPAAGDGEAKPEEPAVNGEQEKAAEGTEEQNAAGDAATEQTNGEPEPAQETEAKPEPEQVEQAEAKADEQTATS